MRCEAKAPTTTSRCSSRCACSSASCGARLAAHRAALVALTHPELEALGDHASSERFQSLFTRFEATLQEARDVREAIVGSFDVLIARGGHHTNQIMKVLTLASVILLPGTLLAGVMGMNFDVPLFDYPAVFWVVIALIVATAAVTVTVADAARLDLRLSELRNDLRRAPARHRPALLREDEIPATFGRHAGRLPRWRLAIPRTGGQQAAPRLGEPT